MKGRHAREIHEPGFLAERARVVRGHVARRDHEIARLNRCEHAVDVFEEIEALDSREPAALSREAHAFLRGVAVLEIDEEELVAL